MDMKSFYPINGELGSKYSINRSGQVMNRRSGRILAGSMNAGGYMAYTLTINGRAYTRMAHRLVAEQFIPNPNNLEIVNHLDENKMNPRCDNLEWVTHRDNLIYGTCGERSGYKRSRRVSEYSLTGKYIRTWKSAKWLCRYFGIPCDNTHRPSQFYRLLEHNTEKDSAKKIFAGRIFMYGVGDHDLDITTQKVHFRNEEYERLLAPDTVPDEYVFTV